MGGSSHSPGLRPAGRGALAAYVLAWAVVGATAAFGVLAILRDGEDTVALPPVRQTELVLAAERADCQLQRGGDARRTDPPVEGQDARPVKGGVYSEAPARGAIVGALRRGMVVINYRPDLPDADVEELTRLQQAIPEGTIVAPNPRLRTKIAVTAWRRLLACRKLDDASVDAVRLFQGRYVGSGPNTPR